VYKVLLFTFSVLLLFTCKLLTDPELPRFAVDGVPTPPLIMQALVEPVGAPLSQLLPVAKSPVAAVQEVDGPASEPHWAWAGIAEKCRKTKEKKTPRRRPRGELVMMFLSPGKSSWADLPWWLDRNPIR
jgi:hypothetical protein